MNEKELNSRIADKQLEIEICSSSRNTNIGISLSFVLCGSLTGIILLNEPSIYNITFIGTEFLLATIYGTIGCVHQFQINRLKKQKQQLLTEQKKLLK